MNLLKLVELNIKNSK